MYIHELGTTIKIFCFYIEVGWSEEKGDLLSLAYNITTPSFQPALSRMAPRGGGGEKKSAPDCSGISNPPSSGSSNKVKLEKGFSRGTLDLSR